MFGIDQASDARSFSLPHFLIEITVQAQPPLPQLEKSREFLFWWQRINFPTASERHKRTSADTGCAGVGKRA
jgi:hypothetical protein